MNGGCGSKGVGSIGVVASPVRETVIRGGGSVVGGAEIREKRSEIRGQGAERRGARVGER